MSTWQNVPGSGYEQGPPGPGFILPGANAPYGQAPPYGQGAPPYGQGAPPYGQAVPPPGYPGYGGQGPPPPGGIPYGEPQQPGMYGAPYQGGSAEDPMHDEVKGFGFSDKTIRNGFIRKVYTILMCQLLITLGMIALFLFHEPTQRWVAKHGEIAWICLGVTLVTIICMSCCTSVRRKAPTNFIFLFVFTIAEGFLLATMASRYESQEVLLAVGITATVCLGLTIFAFQTKWDFTGMHAVLFVGLLILLLFGILAIFIKGKIMTLIYASLGAFIFSMYLIYDTQMMVGGKHKYSISPEEYIFAALSLYLDIVNIFVYILAIIGASRD